MWNAIACAGNMVRCQNNIINDNKHIQDLQIKLERYQEMEDSITESLNYSQSVWDELTEGTQNASNYLLESSVTDADKNYSDAKNNLEDLKRNGASKAEIEQAEEYVTIAENDLKEKRQKLADAKNNTNNLINASKTLANQYFTKQQEAQRKNAQKLEKRCTTELERWKNRLTIHQAEYDGFQKGFTDAAKDEFTPKFAK